MTQRRPRTIISPLADIDIEDLLAHTEEEWGYRQRVAYGRRLRGAIRDLQQFPERGAARDDLFPGLRANVVGRHVIYSLLEENTLYIVRILHARRDPDRIDWTTTIDPDPS